MADQTRVFASRNTKLYYVAWHSTTRLPDNTTLWGTAWGTPSGQTGAYVDAGYTIGGERWRFSVDRAEILVDQELDPVLRPATGRDCQISTNLAEFSAANVKLVAGQGTITTTAATTAARGNDDLDIVSTVADNYYTVGIDAQNPGDSEALRIVLWKCLMTGAPETVFAPTEAAQLPLEASAVPDTSTSPARIAKVRDIIPIG